MSHEFVDRMLEQRKAGELRWPVLLRQVAVYAGFPAAWNALATMKTALTDFDEAPS